MDQYEVLKILGEGSFGSAILAKNKTNDEVLVLKRIPLKKLSNVAVLDAKKEAQVMSSLHHPYITQFFHCLEKPGEIIIAMEYCGGGDLRAIIQQRGNILFPQDRILDWFIQLCLAVKYIHDKHILHRDIKTQNIFLTEDGKIKLGDFGISKILDNSAEFANTCIGTPYYISPEICQNKPYNSKSDVWALGCVLYEMAALKHPFQASCMKSLVMKIMKGSFRPVPSKFSWDFKALIRQIFQSNPLKRPSVTTILAKKILIERVSKFLTQVEDDMDLLTALREREDLNKKIGKFSPYASNLNGSPSKKKKHSRKKISPVKYYAKPSVKFIGNYSNSFQKLNNSSKNDCSDGNKVCDPSVIADRSTLMPVLPKTIENILSDINNGKYILKTKSPPKKIICTKSKIYGNKRKKCNPSIKKESSNIVRDSSANSYENDGHYSLESYNGSRSYDNNEECQPLHTSPGSLKPSLVKSTSLLDLNTCFIPTINIEKYYSQEDIQVSPPRCSLKNNYNLSVLNAFRRESVYSSTPRRRHVWGKWDPLPLSETTLETTQSQMDKTTTADKVLLHELNHYSHVQHSTSCSTKRDRVRIGMNYMEEHIFKVPKHSRCKAMGNNDIDFPKVRKHWNKKSDDVLELLSNAEIVDNNTLTELVTGSFYNQNEERNSQVRCTSADIVQDEEENVSFIDGSTNFPIEEENNSFVNSIEDDGISSTLFPFVTIRNKSSNSQIMNETRLEGNFSESPNHTFIISEKTVLGKLDGESNESDTGKVIEKSTLSNTSSQNFLKKISPSKKVLNILRRKEGYNFDLPNSNMQCNDKKELIDSKEHSREMEEDLNLSDARVNDKENLHNYDNLSLKSKDEGKEFDHNYVYLKEIENLDHNEVHLKRMEEDLDQSAVHFNKKGENFNQNEMYLNVPRDLDDTDLHLKGKENLDLCDVILECKSPDIENSAFEIDGLTKTENNFLNHIDEHCFVNKARQNVENASIKESFHTNKNLINLNDELVKSSDLDYKHVNKVERNANMKCRASLSSFLKKLVTKRDHEPISVDNFMTSTNRSEVQCKTLESGYETSSTMATSDSSRPLIRSDTESVESIEEFNNTVKYNSSSSNYDEMKKFAQAFVQGIISESTENCNEKIDNSKKIISFSRKFNEVLTTTSGECDNKDNSGISNGLMDQIYNCLYSTVSNTQCFNRVMNDNKSVVVKSPKKMLSHGIDDKNKSFDETKEKNTSPLCGGISSIIEVNGVQNDSNFITESDFDVHQLNVNTSENGEVNFKENENTLCALACEQEDTEDEFESISFSYDLKSNFSDCSETDESSSVTDIDVLDTVGNILISDIVESDLKNIFFDSQNENESDYKGSKSTETKHNGSIYNCEKDQFGIVDVSHITLRFPKLQEIQQEINEQCKLFDSKQSVPECTGNILPCPCDVCACGQTNSSSIQSSIASNDGDIFGWIEEQKELLEQQLGFEVFLKCYSAAEDAVISDTIHEFVSGFQFLFSSGQQTLPHHSEQCHGFLASQIINVVKAESAYYS